LSGDAATAGRETLRGLATHFPPHPPPKKPG
jgi:hypothetical protein